MEIQPAQSFPDVSNFMVQTYMDEQKEEVEQNQQTQSQNGGDIVSAVQNLDSKINDFSSSFSDRLATLTNSIESVLENSKQTLSQLSSVLEQQKDETRSREAILEEKFLLAEEEESDVNVEKSLEKLSEFIDELSLDIVKIRPEDTDSFLDTIKGMPKWVIGTLIAIGVVTAAQLGLPEGGGGGSENLPAGTGNGGNLSISGDPNASVINKNLGTNYGTYKKVGGSISWRNNNPGNVTYGEIAKRYGAIGYTIDKDKNKQSVFPTMAQGETARRDLLFNPRYKYHDKSIRWTVEKYAPRAGGGNPDAYAAAITKALGLPETTILSSLTRAQQDTMLEAMKKMEYFREGAVIPLEGKMGTKAPDSNAATIQPGAENEITDILKNLAKKYDAQITSLKRSPEKNAEVGGAKNSFHLRGMAGDFIVPAKNRQAFIKEAESMGLEAIIYKGHIHLEPAPGSSLLSKKKQASEQSPPKKEPAQTNASLGEKKSDSGQNLLTSSQDVKRNKMQSTSNMVSMINGSAPKQQNASSSNKPDLIPAINLKNSMVA